MVKASDNRSFDYLIQKVTAPENLKNDLKISGNFPQKSIIKMDTKTVRDLRSIASNKGLRGYYKLKKDGLVTLSLEQPAEEMPTPSPRTRGKERRSVPYVKIISSPQEMDGYEKEEMKRSSPVVKNVKQIV